MASLNHHIKVEPHINSSNPHAMTETPLHHVVQMYQCVYEDCGEVRPSQASLKSHMDMAHSKPKRFACPDCDYTCALKQCLTSHMRGVHGKGRPLVPCPYEECSVKRLSKSAIQLHVDSVHLKLKRHFCHLCEYKSCDSNSLNVHLRGVHNFGGKYQCTFEPGCKTKCVTKAALQNHINNKHLKLHNYHTCHVCDYTTHSVRDYRRHLDSHKQPEQTLEEQQQQAVAAAAEPSKRGRKPKAPVQIVQQVSLPPSTTQTVDLNSLHNFAHFQQLVQIQQQQQQHILPVFPGQVRTTHHQASATNFKPVS